MLLSDSEYGLGLTGTPAPLASRLFGITGESKAGQDYSELGLQGRPDNPRSFSGRSASSQQDFVVSDTASLSAVESTVDFQEITTYDLARLSTTEISQYLFHILASDSANLVVSENVNLQIAGVTAKAVTDTGSLSATDASAIAVTVDVTDTASLSSSESSAVAVSAEQISATDTASLSATDEALINIFAGLNVVNVTDDAVLSASDTANRVEVNRIRRITFTITSPRIELEIL